MKVEDRSPLTVTQQKYSYITTRREFTLLLRWTCHARTYNQMQQFVPLLFFIF